MAAPPAIPRRGLFIGGGWREPALGRRIPVINPATEDTIGTFRRPVPFPLPSALPPHRSTTTASTVLILAFCLLCARLMVGD
jgi:hypothetical protein